MAVARAARRSTVVVAMAALLTILLPGTPASAGSDQAAISRLVALVNDARAERGLPPLSVRGDLAAVAARHSVRMADRGEIHHNASLQSEVGGWRELGENVGRGGSADGVHAAFMDSAGHRGNVLSSSFTEIGIGVERRGDELWVTQVFRLPDGAAPPAPPPAEPAPSTASPAPRTEPSARTHRHAGSSPDIAEAPLTTPPSEGLLRRLELSLTMVEDHDGSSDTAVALRRLGLDPRGHLTTARAAEHGVR